MCVCAHAQSLQSSFLTLWDPADCSLPGSSVHGILQARILEWGAISFLRSKTLGSPPAYPHLNWLPGVPTFPAAGFGSALPSPCLPHGLPLPQAQASLSPDPNTTLVCLTSRQNKKNKNKQRPFCGKNKNSTTELYFPAR